MVVRWGPGGLILPKNINDLLVRLACHTPPLKKEKKQGEMPLTSLGPIPSLNSTFFNGMELRLDNGISPCFFAFLRRTGPSLNLFCFSEKICFLYIDKFSKPVYVGLAPITHYINFMIPAHLVLKQPLHFHCY